MSIFTNAVYYLKSVKNDVNYIISLDEARHGKALEGLLNRYFK